MKMNNLLMACSFIVLGLVAYQNPAPTTEDLFPRQLNLLQHGIPISIQAPEDAKVTNRSDNFMQDVVVEGTDYYVQIYSQSVSSVNCKSMASEEKTEIKKNNPTF